MAVKTPDEVFADFELDGVTPNEPLLQDIRILLNYIQDLAQAAGTGMTSFTSVAAMNADLNHDAGTIGAVIDATDPAHSFPRLVYVKNGASGAGSWVAGADTLSPLFSLAAPMWMTASVDKIPIYIDRGGAADGTFNKLRVSKGPYTIYRNGLLRDAVTATNASSGVSGWSNYCELAYTHAGLWLLYYDNGDNTIKCVEKAGWAAAAFPSQAEEIFVLALISGSAIFTQLLHHDFFDSLSPVIVPNGPLIHLEAEGKLLVPSVRQMIGTAVNTIAPDPATGLAYWEVNVQTGAPLIPNAHYFDVVSGKPLSVATNHPAPIGYKSTLLARSHNNVVHSPFALISRKTGGLAPNQLPNGTRPIQTPLKSTNAAEVALAASAASATGFTYAVQNTVDASHAVHVGDVMVDTRPAQPFFARCTVTIAAADSWTNVIPRAVFLPAPGAQPVSVNLVLEKILADELDLAGPSPTSTTKSRIYSIAARVPSQDFFGATVFNWYAGFVGAWVNGVNSIFPQVSGCQFSVANGAAWISRNDFTSQQTFQTRLSGVEAQLADPAPQILYPDHMFLAEGIPLDLYPDRLMETPSAGGSFILTVESQRTGITRKPFLKDSKGGSIELDPTRIGPPLCNLIMRRYSDASGQGTSKDYRYAKQLTAHTAAAPYTGTVKIAMIGDSIWANDVVNYVKLEVQNLGYTATMIGTMDNAGSLGEARVGIKASDLTNATTGKLPIVSVADYNARNSTQNDANGKWGYNPMMRPSTGGDPAGFINNGQIYDYGNYLSIFGLSTPDFIIFDPGTNDLLNASFPTSVNNIQAAIDIIYQQTRTACPNAHICFCLPSPAETGSMNPVWQEEYTAAIKWLMNYVRGKRTGGDAKVWAVGLWAHMSPNGGFVVVGSSNVTIATDSQTQMLTVQLNDGLHPFTAGRRQIAEVITSWIACCQQGV